MCYNTEDEGNLQVRNCGGRRGNPGSYLEPDHATRRREIARAALRWRVAGNDGDEQQAAQLPLKNGWPR